MYFQSYSSERFMCVGVWDQWAEAYFVDIKIYENKLNVEDNKSPMLLWLSYVPMLYNHLLQAHFSRSTRETKLSSVSQFFNFWLQLGNAPRVAISGERGCNEKLEGVPKSLDEVLATYAVSAWNSSFL